MIIHYGLQEPTVQKICGVFAKNPEVQKVLLYGSRAKGTYKNGSDIDLTMIGDEDLTLDIQFRIMDEIDELFLPYTFELSIFNQISDKDLINHIPRVGIVFYERKKLRTPN